MFKRKITAPQQCFFLFGPRATGKSTWLNLHFKKAKYYNLLQTGEFLRLNANPELLYSETRMLKPGEWVVIDEVQRAPMLLNEVHRIIEEGKLQFALSGSSARKLRKGGHNLLAGRAIIKHLFPLLSSEMDFDIDVTHAIKFGTLPLAINSPNPVEYLQAYADVYLREEIQAEALTRNLSGFSRFLEIAARQNGQITSFTSIARDAAINRHTVSTYFDILCDTLIGFWLPAWQLKTRTKQVQQPKFYLFDCGVARALSARLPYPPTTEEEGPLLETFLLNEIRAYLEYSKKYYPIHYWRSYSGLEVDVFCETANGFVAIEIKSSKRWDKKFNRGINTMRNELPDHKVTCYGIYQGSKSAVLNNITIFPVIEFLKEMWQGKIFA